MELDVSLIFDTMMVDIAGLANLAMITDPELTKAYMDGIYAFGRMLADSTSKTEPGSWRRLAIELSAEVAALEAETKDLEVESVELLEALVLAMQFIRNGIEFGYITLPDTPDPARETLSLIDEAIAKARGA